MVKRLHKRKKIQLPDLTTRQFIWVILWISLIQQLAYFAIQVHISAQYAGLGKEVLKLEQRKAELEREIAIMKLEQAHLGSLKRIHEEAIKMGFVKVKEIHFIKLND